MALPTNQTQAYTYSLAMWRKSQYPSYRDAVKSGGLYYIPIKLLGEPDSVGFHLPAVKDMVMAARVAADCCGESDLVFVLTHYDTVLDIY